MTHPVYNKKTIARTLDISPSRIEMILIKENQCSVTLKITPEEALNSIHQARKANSMGYSIIDNKDGTYHAVAPEKKTNPPYYNYQLVAKDKYIHCECTDYLVLSSTLNNPQVCCKHVYALLNHLGCSDLSEYIQMKFKLNTNGYELRDYLGNNPYEYDKLEEEEKLDREEANQEYYESRYAY